ncbi:MAG: hypothetical protein KYX66_23055 [Blastomonas fulva]|uniref:hypothetical protein n=1 Tax=Blastomonas fulva TaxID=1550728 RepID=UPI0024E21138|nr:hypothetical protein [Blastomonas fulva]MDK2759606.1 hypothetical protein [Blastomonas fulva]
MTGAQLLISFASSTLMSFLPTGKVGGEHLVDRESVISFPVGAFFAPAGQIVAQAGAPVEAMTKHMLEGRAVAELTNAKGIKLFNAANGAPLPPIDAKVATRIAEAAWKSDDKPKSTASLVTQESPEYRAALPAWRVTLVDSDRTSLFVAQQTERLTVVRTDTWLLNDFFWRLHVMDWKNHKNFNTWWLLSFASGGLLLGLAGTVLLVMRWPVRRKRRHAA